MLRRSDPDQRGAQGDAGRDAQRLVERRPDVFVMQLLIAIVGAAGGAFVAVYVRGTAAAL